VDDDGLSPIATYSFDWGDRSPGTTQSSATATHTYRAVGTYTVRVKVTDTAGLSSTATHVVTVRDDPPRAKVSASPSSGPGPLNVTADASASSDGDLTPIKDYRFDWGDGSPATGPQSGPTATHTYDSPGVYTLRVTVTDTAGQVSEATTEVRQYGADAPPTAALSVTPPSGTVDLDVTADGSASSDTDNSIVSYSFDWGDGSQPTGPQPTPIATHTYSAPGTYTVSLRVIDSAGAPSTATTQVVVSPNLVGNPGFESALTGWNTSGSGAGVTLTRVAGGHRGDWSAQLANGASTAATCSLNDAPDWVRKSVAGGYRYSIWVRGASAGATIKTRVTEFSGTTSVGSRTTTATLTTSWQQLTVDYTTVSPGTTLDFNTYITNAPPGTCFFADDASIAGP
jgi:PKD repeat protein